MRPVSVEARAPRGARISGDVILGGLFPVHEKSERSGELNRASLELIKAN